MTESGNQNTMESISSDYMPVIYKFEDGDDNIFNYEPDPTFSRNIGYPKFSLGFQHYIHQSKTKMEITSEFKDKKKVYYVISKFERNIDDYDKDIGHMSANYFDLNNKPNILSRSFYKLWEILMMFDLIDLNKSDFTSAHLAEGPGSFIQATMFYRDMFCKKNLSKNDKYYAVTLHGEGIDKHVQNMSDEFIKFYSKEKPQRVFVHKTYPKDVARLSKVKDNGDLTNPKTINLFGGNFDKQKADLVTADGGFEWGNENIQEQESYKLILAQIIMALKIQNKGGNFVCKVYESFTDITVKLLNILKSFYKEMMAVKPLTSRGSNSEKYIVCMNFIDSKDNKKNIEKLELILNEMNKNSENLVDIFPKYNLTDKFKAIMISLNIDIANKQFIDINEMVDFIKKQNYRGDEYQKRRSMQIDASIFWLSKFFVDNLDVSKKFFKEFSSMIIEKNNMKINNLKNKLDFR